MADFSIAEQLQHITCQIETDIGTGTGFIYAIATKDKRILPMLVTNRHVIEGSSKTRFRITNTNLNDEPDFGNIIEFEINSTEWKMHPSHSIDLAMLNINSCLYTALRDGQKPFFIHLGKESIANEKYLKEMDAIENIIMIGYPIGVFDEENNLPVTRRGITASRIGLKYNGKPEFLIDCACFPGSSGSPIFQFDAGPYLQRNGTLSLGGFRFKFLGILYGGPAYDANGVIVAKPVETSINTSLTNRTMTNLGYCIRASELHGFDLVFKSEIEAFNNSNVAEEDI